MKIRIPSIFSVTSFFLDGLAITLSFLTANWIRFYSGWMKVEAFTNYPHYRTFLLLFVLVHLLIFKYIGLYRKRRGISGVDEISKVVQAVVISATLVAASTFLVKFFSFSRLVIVLSKPL